MTSEIKKGVYRQIAPLTLIRTVLNTGFRMIYPFQPFFMEELGIGLGEMTRMLAGRSLVGIFSPLTASVADSRGRKTGMLLGVIIFSLGALIFLFWTTGGGLLAFLLLSTISKAIFDPSLQAYFGDRVPYSRRGFVLALTEMSWSGAFFLGVPLVGFLIRKSGLTATFLGITVLGAVSFLVIVLLIPADPLPERDRPSLLQNFWTVFSSRAALAGLTVSLLIAAANEVVNVVFGVWLNDSFSLQIAALGGASAVIGLSELIGEGAVSAVSDVLSKKKAVFWGALSNSGAALSLILLGRVQWGAVLGLFLFYLTFEFTIVSAIPLMTGVVPEARATMMALNIASVSLGRGLGSLVAAPLYSRGFLFNAVAGAVINLLALVALRLVIVKEKG